MAEFQCRVPLPVHVIEDGHGMGLDISVLNNLVAVTSQIQQGKVIMKALSIFSLLALIALGCDSDSDTRTTPSGDNTEVNERDRSEAAQTPMSQDQNQEDIDITAKIRKQVMDGQMSVNAQNAKIITQDGHVTLRGPVATVDERSKLESIARAVAGESNVDSQLDIVE